MNQETRDIVRQALTVIGAIFQVVAGFFTGTQMSVIANEYRSAILPAGYAFAIWTPIFILAAVYAVWQAFPANRQRPLFRQIGWLLAAGFIGNGLWELLFPGEWFLLAQAVITAILAVLAVAYWRLVRTAPEGFVGRAERWLVALLVGLYFGWITAAAAVGLATTLVIFEVAATGAAAIGVGVALLAASGALAVSAIRAGRGGLRPLWLAYAAAVIWALIGVAVNQLGPSPVTGGAAVAIAVVVLAVIGRQAAVTTAAKQPLPVAG
jgi:hypothetical protein